jgi:AraC-like DNA-binding protein
MVIDFLITQKITFSITSYPVEAEKIDTAQVIQPHRTSNRISEEVKQLLERIYLKYISENNSISPTIEEVAKEVGWNPALFKSRFKSYYGKPFYQAYIEQKMKYAAELLTEGWKAVEVSEKVGYSQPIKFNKMFQKYFGITPHKFKRQNSKK